MRLPTRVATAALSLFIAGTSVAPALCHAAAPQDAALQTVAERSKFQRTGRYDEVVRLCAAYERAWRDAVRCTQFGRTPEGRPMLVLAISRTGALTPEQARKQNLPVMLMQGGIHAGESDGKDAGLLAVRELLNGEAAAGALKSFVLVFVPVFNVDGHERFGRWNRPNQIGPEEMGWRATAQEAQHGLHLRRVRLHVGRLGAASARPCPGAGAQRENRENGLPAAGFLPELRGR